MLSSNIRKTANALEGALALGEPLDFQMQLRMVRLMGHWEAMAYQMERRDQEIYPPTRGFGRPVLVGGLDHIPEPSDTEDQEVREHVQR